jgi:membrane-associated protease RseP (regulator of RpoE activity)
MRLLRAMCALVGGLAVAAPAGAQVRTCPGGQAVRGDAGIGAVRCVGPRASCTINIADEHGFRHTFAVEPIVSVVADSTKDAAIRTGDRIVSVGGFLITTVEGGRRLANLHEGRPVTILVRRDEKLLEINVTPVRGCGITSLSVRP